MCSNSILLFLPILLSKYNQTCSVVTDFISLTHDSHYPPVTGHALLSRVSDGGGGDGESTINTLYILATILYILFIEQILMGFLTHFKRNNMRAM